MCGTGYTGEEGVELLVSPEDAPACGTSWRGAARARRASARATPCAWRPAFTSTATSSREERGPIEAGLGWCCKEDTGFIGSEAPCRAPSAQAGPGREKARRVHDRRSGHRPSGQPGRRRRRGHERHALACLEVGIGMAYVPAERAAVGTRLQIDVRGKDARGAVHPKPLRPKRA